MFRVICCASRIQIGMPQALPKLRVDLELLIVIAYIFPKLL